MSKVFVPQEPMKKDAESGRMVSMFALNKASGFGDVVIMLPPGAVALSPAPTVFALQGHLRKFTDDDYLIAAGDPSVIAIAAAIAASNNRGRFKLLKWDKEAKTYIKVEVDMYKKLGQGLKED